MLHLFSLPHADRYSIGRFNREYAFPVLLPYYFVSVSCCTQIYVLNSSHRGRHERIGEQLQVPLPCVWVEEVAHPQIFVCIRSELWGVWESLVIINFDAPPIPHFPRCGCPYQVSSLKQASPHK